MINKRIVGTTIVLGAPAGWKEQTDDANCVGLAVRVETLGRLTVCHSAWEPTPEELERLNAGASVILSVVGGQPPVALEVGEIPE